ncbi:MAG: chromosome segregation SMC family protein [archaeon]
MPFVKKLVMSGFKSFAKPTEILFDKTMNTIVGPNGSGKSNVSDAICFVLGRLSIKSIRAEKAANLIYNGGKENRPSDEARVEMIFDNSDKVLSGSEEMKIARIVKRDGQSIYKIDGKTKTRQEVLDLLAQAGIDPYGFNIILQGEISRFVEMRNDERRVILEDIAGISIYETRKEKSLKELERTDERLKEVNTILRERTAYLKNLEEDRQQALKFKKLEETVKRCKASILRKKIEERTKERKEVDESISKEAGGIEKTKSYILKLEEEIKKLNSRIEEINAKIQKSSGVEQTSLTENITELKAEIAGLSVRKENYQNQLDSIARREEELEKSISDLQKETDEMRKSKGKSVKQEVESKKRTLEGLEERKAKFYSLKSSLNVANERYEDKKKELQKAEHEYEFTFRKIEETEALLKFKDNLEKCRERLSALRKEIENAKKNQQEAELKILESEKEIAACSRQISDTENVKKHVAELDICPLCKTKITSEHIENIDKEANEKIAKLKQEIDKSKKQKEDFWGRKEDSIAIIKETGAEIEEREKDILRLETLEDKKSMLRDFDEARKRISNEINELESKRKQTQKSIAELEDIEQKYELLKLDVDELKRHEEVDVGTEISYKLREMERVKVIIRQISAQAGELEKEVLEIGRELDRKQKEARDKERQEQEIQVRYKRMFEEKNNLQDKVRMFETDMLKKQNDARFTEERTNNFRIKKAEVNAQIETLEMEFKEFGDVEVIKASVEELQARLESSQRSLDVIGSVNLKALEVYDSIKKDYEEIALKVELLDKEKQEILKIIEEIDKKKKNNFMKTLNTINQLFSDNFSRLSTKGQAWLELENPSDVFAGGLDIVVRIAKGKYMDINSLSGGEQVLVALSLIFAIQEHKPYCFYIFDEIDAALDKRNSERLAGLLISYTKKSQCIVITHNDSIISNSATIYGVSMQDGVSKIISLKL